jgi:hypothetical protein
MYRQIFFVLAISLFCTRVQSQNNEQVIFDRIEYIFNLKPILAKKYWKDFDKKKYDVSLLYFTDSSSYIANPPNDFIRAHTPKLVFQSRKISLYKTVQRFDTISFHMETSFYSDGPAKGNILPTPTMYCSSFEVTSKKITETTSTEYWATMVIHEYFHGFQFKHTSYADAVMENSGNVPEDSIAKIFKNNAWFQQKIKRENELLLKAIQSGNKSDTKNYIDSFFAVRRERRTETKRAINFDIEKYEKLYETMEGTARYIEYCLQAAYATKKPDKKLLAADTAYHSYTVFKNYTMENDPWLYTPGNRYFYATGFNMVRLLDKLNIEYKQQLFNEGGLSLEQVLMTNQQTGR